MIDAAIASVPIKKISPGKISAEEDFLACEEPLEISLEFGEENNRILKSISVTMRTPGHDEELAAGFLFTEGIIRQNDVLSFKHGSAANRIIVDFHGPSIPDLKKLERNFYTTSSCGVCGKSALESVRILAPAQSEKDDIEIHPDVFYSLAASLRNAQDVFEQTGGLHASALFDLAGNLHAVREDVGRHNALDKLIGSLLIKGSLPLPENILMLSGRASFELIQKAAMAGIKVIAAVGAPSSFAAELAGEFDMTLIGFLRENRFNIYSGEKRILLEKA